MSGGRGWQAAAARVPLRPGQPAQPGRLGVVLLSWLEAQQGDTWQDPWLPKVSRASGSRGGSPHPRHCRVGRIGRVVPVLPGRLLRPAGGNRHDGGHQWLPGRQGRGITVGDCLRLLTQSPRAAGRGPASYTVVLPAAACPGRFRPERASGDAGVRRLRAADLRAADRPQLDGVGSSDLRPQGSEAVGRTTSSIVASSCASSALASGEVWLRWISV
jgi:hypothetical protein